MADAEFADFLRWLDSFLNFERLPQKDMFWLDSMEFLCGRLGHPERAARCVHVAGSKGKGSVSAMIAGIIQAAGHSCGLYASPHISSFFERITQCGAPLRDALYGAAAQELRAAIDAVPQKQLPGGRPPTWFELVTLYAFLCFRKAGFPYAVYEVGLGGRLDASNVITPEVCCICPIELEHTEFLGGTVEKIAAEKAGIIKESVPVICAQQTDEARRVLTETARQKHAPLFFTDDECAALHYEYTARRTMLTEFSLPRHFEHPIRADLRLLGRVQARNAVLASLAAKQLFPDISTKTIEEGLHRAALPARFELQQAPHGFDGIPHIIMDGAHTPRSIAFAIETYTELFDTKPVLLFACARDKDARAMAPLFRNLTDTIFLTRPGAAKAADMDLLTTAFREAGLAFSADEDYLRCIHAAMECAHMGRRPLLVTGSFYLAAEVKSCISG